MTVEIFTNFINDLQNYFGTRPLSDIVKAQYFKVCEPIENSKARELFGRILKDAKYFPKIPELAGYVSATLGERKKEYVAVRNSARCFVCMDKGLIQYTRKIRNIDYDFLARCPRCEVGKAFENSPTIAYNALFGEEATDTLAETNRRKYGGIGVSEAKETVAKNYGAGMVQSFERGIGNADI